MMPRAVCIAVCLSISLAATRPNLARADYVLPTFSQVVEGSNAIVDASVESLDANGHPTLKIHGYFKGKNAATTITGIALSCTGELPQGMFAAGERYVIALNKDRLYEGRTIYPVRKDRNGNLTLWYRDVKTLESESLSFAEFQRRVSDERKKAIVKDLVVAPGVPSPLRWLADSRFDPEQQPFRGWSHPDSLRKLLDRETRPWSVDNLVAMHQRALDDAAKPRAGETAEEKYQRHLRTVAPMNMLAATRDIRAVIALGEALNSSVESVPKSAAAILRDTYRATPTWPTEHKDLVEAAKAWWKNHEEGLRTELRELGGRQAD